MPRSTEVTTPWFVFSLTRVRQNAEVFRALCDQTFLSCGYEAYFPIKVAPSQAIVSCLREMGYGLEAINGRTREIAQLSPGSQVILGGPAKTELLISQGLQSCLWTYVSCESLTDLRRVNALALRHGKPLAVLLRLKATARRRLGMSLEDAGWALIHARDFPALTIVGLHLHSGSNLTCHEADLMLDRMRSAISDLARDGLRIDILNFGGGMPCVIGNETEIRRRLEGFARLADAHGTRVILEPGRALVGDAGKLIAAVTDVRPADRELTINVAAYVIHGPCNADKFVVHRRRGEIAEHRYQVVKRKEANFRIGGIWPAEGDSLWLNVPEAEFAIGDQIIFPQAGAYSMGFVTELSFDGLTPVITD